MTTSKNVSGVISKIIPYLSNIKKKDIDVFYNTKQLKKDNDRNNKTRELILLYIGNKKILEEWYSDKKWNNVRNSFNNVIKSLYVDNYDNFTIIQKAGINFNYDFIINYLDKSNNIIITKKIEFKYNCENISKCPQFINVSSKKFIKSYCYAEFFYDNYIKEISELAEIPEKEIIDKPIYMKYVHNMKSNNEFFQKLIRKEIEIKKAKKEIVNKSIYEYLFYFANIDIDAINKYMLEKQYNKYYIFYKNGSFYKDYITKDELTVISIKEIKNNNTIVLNTRSNTKIEMLLRWKNYSGVLYTSWQIKLIRNY